VSLEFYVEKFQNLNMNSAGGKKSPHKVCMLLTVMDLIQAGHLVKNRIEFNQAVKDRFSHYFDSFAQGNDRNTPENPFYHLKSEGFWHLSYRIGFDETNTKRYSAKAIEYAYLDQELFEYLKSPIVSNDLKDALVANFADLPSLFCQWLLDIGKSESTANKYVANIQGAISNWLADIGELEQPLTEVKSYKQFIRYEERVRQLDEFKIRDSRGNGMYSAALDHYHQFLIDLSQIDVNADVRDVMSDKKLTETEKTILINTRMGQGQFRAKLIEMWGGCAVTGYRNTQLLLASHIKPWRSSNNQERLDKYNGLLLVANLDKAFDLGFISFDDGGKVMISKYLEAPDVLGLREGMSFNIRQENKPYLGYHRGVLFKGF
jgi:predicted restriction endonuclease